MFLKALTEEATITPKIHQPDSDVKFESEIKPQSGEIRRKHKDKSDHDKSESTLKSDHSHLNALSGESEKKSSSNANQISSQLETEKNQSQLGKSFIYLELTCVLENFP